MKIVKEKTKKQSDKEEALQIMRSVYKEIATHLLFNKYRSQKHPIEVYLPKGTFAKLNNKINHESFIYNPRTGEPWDIKFIEDVNNNKDYLIFYGKSPDAQAEALRQMWSRDEQKQIQLN